MRRTILFLRFFPASLGIISQIFSPENLSAAILALSREAQLFVGWVSGSVTHAGVGFHASTQPTFICFFRLV
ncbi:MAG: hypothetical protein EWV83_05380 [Microcystis sp. M_OC_Ca_00000000_S217Cul]|nr:MAG: hypothetical protein EWV83_05380 [Microcystis sp. M_OC_Ca_00000000_S217Cul]TRT85451.1 MAG: hypothetical protein EWV66_18400 [Microcystis sp. M_OC_Ca_00000000_C217Col]